MTSNKVTDSFYFMGEPAETRHLGGKMVMRSFLRVGRSMPDLVPAITLLSGVWDGRIKRFRIWIL